MKSTKSGPVRVVAALSPVAWQEARALVIEYERSLGVDLCFQGFERELAEWPGEYAPPGGALFLAYAGERPAGCVALRPLPESAAEMKRLYVRPEGRGQGLGAALAEAAVAEARRLGYSRLRLDTLPQMTEARALYQRMGFREIGAYTLNPVPGAVFLERDLAPPADIRS